MLAMMKYTGLHDKLNTRTWTECVATMTKLKNIMINIHE